MTAVTLATGCASTPVPNSEPKEAPDTSQVGDCIRQNSPINSDYPWTMPGHHNTLTRQTGSFGITQTEDDTNQFVICADCPCPTLKRAAKVGTAVTRLETKANLKKTVIHFAPASYQLDEHQQQILRRFHRSLPDRYQLTITGYTDDTTPGGTITNASLARLRAKAVFDFLVTLGLEARHATIKASPLCCYVASNTTASGRALNRRAEIVMSSLSTQR